MASNWRESGLISPLDTLFLARFSEFNVVFAAVTAVSISCCVFCNASSNLLIVLILSLIGVKQKNTLSE
jgi:hypothetical protein